MSKDLFVKILLPINGYDEKKIYDENEVSLSRAYSFSKSSPYVVKLRVRSFYTSMEAIKSYAEKKYGLPKIGDCSMSYEPYGGRILSVGANTYRLSSEEIEALRVEHFDVGYYCDIETEIHLDIYADEILRELLPDGVACIDDNLFFKAVKLIKKEFHKTDESLEDYVEYSGIDLGKLLIAMLAAREHADEVGGMAILKYI